MDALKIASTALQANEDAMGVVLNNLANMKTAGFKEKKALFSTLPSTDKTRVGSISSTSGATVPAGFQVGGGVQPAGVTTVLKVGTPVQTGNPYHLSIQNSKGYFVIQLPSGENAYTRDGTFELNADGTLVTHQGFTVSPTITIPPNAERVTINSSGEVLVKIPGQTAEQNVGQIEVVDFTNKAGLLEFGNNLLKETKASGAPIAGIAGTDGFGRILQNWYEGSNVQAVTAVMDMVEIQKAYGFATKGMEGVSKMMDAATRIL